MSTLGQMLQDILDMGARMERRLDELTAKMDSLQRGPAPSPAGEGAPMSEIALILTSDNPLQALKEREREIRKGKRLHTSRNRAA